MISRESRSLEDSTEINVGYGSAIEEVSMGTILSSRPETILGIHGKEWLLFVLSIRIYLRLS